MKKLLLALGIMLMVTSLAYAVDEETTSEDESTVAESTGAASVEAPTGVTLSKGDSFLAAFGMQTSQVSGGEAGGITSSAGLTAVAHTAAHVGSVSLTSSQNTPYSYK
ncbi:hypothetical protein OQE61_05750 [Cetobacterium somerae]|uniref:hypothetical protein n=1 Tax=Cetobacterium somerae TaxID=188913 RepID=UPI002253BC15|nr:hypothetical protein [Cetobacterium somerae]MCX3066991.1 hypothetical protein [Cetobacterium somerae]